MSIKTKLTIMFLAIVAIPLLFVSYLTYTDYKNSLKASRLSQLQDLTVLRADKIESYFAGIKAHIDIAQGFYNIKKSLPVLTRLADDQNNPEFFAAKKMLDGQLRLMQSVSELSDIMLINPRGKVVYSSNNSLHFSKDMSSGNDAERMAFSHGKDRAYFSDVYFDKTEDNRYEILLAAPASDFNGAFIGVIAFEVDMATVYKLIRDTTGLGQTGEVLVGRKIGNQVEYLNPLRHEPKIVMKRINIGGQIGGPIQQALEGKTGLGQLIDYRGKKVIAAWRYIPSLDWGMVAKIDTAEAFADVTNLRNLTMIILVIVFVPAGIIAFSIARSISEPIKRLSRGAEIVGSGNLDYKIRTNRRDEIGQLSRSFDKMTQDLKLTTASRDELNMEITERSKKEEQLKQLTEELKRSNKDLEQFAYVASHDLQEPLRAVSGFVDLLKMRLGASLDEKNQEYMNFAVEGVMRMQSLIQGLLEYSRISNSDKKIEQTDSKAALEQAIVYLQTSIKESGAKIIADGLPTVSFDAGQLAQLFQNLIGNAIKFRGETTPEIHISASRHDSAWQFSVADNGIGIEPQYANRIFLIFQRLHTRKTYSGTGIGLAVCKKIVERHNGKIWVEPKAGCGSTFYFTIPDIGEI